ncbi:hypothetical protein YN1_6820 [Nanoarchaeota archaeon]
MEKRAGAGTVLLVLIIIGLIIYIATGGNLSKLQSYIQKFSNGSNISIPSSISGGFPSSSSSGSNFVAYLQATTSISGPTSCLGNIQFSLSSGEIIENNNQVSEQLSYSNGQNEFINVYLGNNGNINYATLNNSEGTYLYYDSSNVTKLISSDLLLVALVAHESGNSFQAYNTTIDSVPSSCFYASNTSSTQTVEVKTCLLRTSTSMLPIITYEEIKVNKECSGQQASGEWKFYIYEVQP